MPTPNMPTPFCPRLTRLNQPSYLDPKATASLQIVPCQGPACAAFIMDLDGEGKPTGRGHCAETITAIAQTRLAMAVEEIANDLIGSDDDEPDQPTVDHITPKTQA